MSAKLRIAGTAVLLAALAGLILLLARPGLDPALAHPMRLVALAWLVFCGAAGLVRGVPVRLAAGLILAGGIVLQVVALAGPPQNSSDLYRYIWDGRIQAAGVDPYRYAPGAAGVAGLRDSFLWSGTGAGHYADCVPARPDSAASAGFGGQYLQDRRFSHPGGSELSGGAPAERLGAPGVEQKPLPRGAEITDIPGLSPFYTPNGQFYRVDTALVVPKISVRDWQLRIHGMVDRPMTVSFKDLIDRPMLDQDITLTCVSDSVGGSRIGNARWQGTLLASVLREAGIQPGATQIVMRDRMGMSLGVATAPVLDGRDALLAIGMNGQALPPEHGFPVRVVVPGLYGYVSACKWVVDMELTTFGAFNAYYKKLGWTADPPPVKTESRIDTPKSGGKLTGGKAMIAGVAWAQHRGIEAVEVGIDRTWHQATLAAQDVLDSWRQWYYPWEATPGNHTLQVRATDKAGYTQTANVRHTFPNGATGYHTIRVTVA